MDQSDFFASSTYRHLRNNAGNDLLSKIVSDYYDNQVFVQGDYRLSFFDGGSEIRVDIDKNTEGVGDLVGRVKEKGLKVPNKYSDVLEDVEVSGELGSLSIYIRPVKMNNAEGRVQNREKLFMALYHTAVRPSLEEISTR